MSSRVIKIRRWVASLYLCVRVCLCVCVFVLSTTELRVRFPVYVEVAQFSSFVLSPYDPCEAGT